MRNIALLAVCASLFGAHFMSQDESTETQAASQSSPQVVISVSPRDGQDETVDEPVETQFVTLRGAVCTAGGCGVVSRGNSAADNSGTTTVRRGLFGRRIVEKSSSGRSSRGGWYLGKNIGRLFSRR